jgi:hypothetical protein
MGLYDISPQTVRVEVVMNLNWAKAYPELLADRVIKFQKEFNNPAWKMSMDLSRDCYMILTAERV